MLRNGDRAIADALGNLAGEPNLQFSNSCENIYFLNWIWNSAHVLIIIKFTIFQIFNAIEFIFDINKVMALLSDDAATLIRIE